MIAPDRYKQRFREAGWDDTTAARWGMIENIDDNMGRLLDKLDEYGLTDKTLVIFLTDNGQSHLEGERNGQPVRLFQGAMRGHKGTPYGRGCASRRSGDGPGRCRRASTVRGSRPTSTCSRRWLSWRGPSGLRRRLRVAAWSPCLQIQRLTGPIDSCSCTWGGGRGGRRQPAGMAAGLCGRRGTRLVNNSELYDVAQDPQETKNVIAEHPQQVAAMREAYDAWWAGIDTANGQRGDAAGSRAPPGRVTKKRQLEASGIPTWQPPPWSRTPSITRGVACASIGLSLVLARVGMGLPKTARRRRLLATHSRRCRRGDARRLDAAADGPGDPRHPRSTTFRPLTSSWHISDPPWSGVSASGRGRRPL